MGIAALAQRASVIKASTTSRRPPQADAVTVRLGQFPGVAAQQVVHAVALQSEAVDPYRFDQVLVRSVSSSPAASSARPIATATSQPATASPASSPKARKAVAACSGRCR